MSSKNLLIIAGDGPVGAQISQLLRVAGLMITLWLCTGCGADDRQGGASGQTEGRADVLLFSGTGTSPNDVKAFETLLKDQHLKYSKVNSSALNRMSEQQMRQFRLLIIPGGNFISIGNGLSPSATTNIHNAVENGLNYLGVCAGAFLAGHLPGTCLNLTGVKFGFYSATDRGIRKMPVPIVAPSGPALEQYWEDGPQLTGWGSIVGKYPDGTPAIVQGTRGAGWVILCGVHPEAPASWRQGMDFNTPVTADTAFACTLIHAALNRDVLPHF
ncbi:MAG TPA: BPL-N domain-containing protein [Verrucomicrobiae bacterium]|nr:BPL-N domain-containing protein [Verrucomicrobiae bacterium]